MEKRLKKLKIYLCLTALFISFSNFAYSFEPIPTSDLLLSYLENDNDLKKNAIEAQKAQLSLDSTKINNGFDISLSTGNITIRQDNSGTSVSVKPSVKATLPEASNLSVTASSNYNYKSDTSSIENTSVNASVDLINSTSLSRKISLMKAERSLEEATRKLRNQAINTEKAFYTELKGLLNSTNSLISLEKTLYQNKIDFEKTKAQGYSSSSSTYRLAQMRVVSGEHDLETSKRSLIHSYIVFYKKCGYDISIDENEDFFNLVPKDITHIEPVDIHSFDADKYTEVESALWTNKINSLQRQTNRNFTLTANGGVTFGNFEDTANTTSIDAGLSSRIGGLNLGAGVSIPTNDPSSPAVTLSATLTPNTFRLNKINNQTQQLNEEQELLAIDTARNNYATKIVDYEQSLSDLNWTKKTNEESYEMYAALEKDMANFYKQGIISESEYISARINSRSYAVRKIINAIDFIIYNDNIVTMFVEE